MGSVRFASLDGCFLKHNCLYMYLGYSFIVVLFGKSIVPLPTSPASPAPCLPPLPHCSLPTAPLSIVPLPTSAASLLAACLPCLPPLPTAPACLECHGLLTMQTQSGRVDMCVRIGVISQCVPFP